MKKKRMTAENRERLRMLRERHGLGEYGGKGRSVLKRRRSKRGRSRSSSGGEPKELNNRFAYIPLLHW